MKIKGIRALGLCILGAVVLYVTKSIMDCLITILIAELIIGGE